MVKKTNFDSYIDSQRDEYRNIYGDIVDRVWNPDRLFQFDNSKYDPLIVFELLDKLYLELSLVYKLDYNIRIEPTSIAFCLDGVSTYISIKEDDYDNEIYIVVSDFYLPKEKINEANEIMKNKSYYRNGYRIIKTIEIICKCWGMKGIKYTHITKHQLAANLRSEGYDNIYKLRGDEYFPDQDYVKWMLKDEEINIRYPVQYEIEESKNLGTRLINKAKKIFRIAI